MQPAEPRELGIFQAGDHTEHVGLNAVLQLGLEADHIVERAQGIVLAQLDDGVGLNQRVAWIGQADGFEWTPAQRLVTALGHDLNG